MLKALILLFLAILQVRLIYTGDILFYLAPQMLSFFYFSTFSLLFLAAFKSLTILAEQRPNHEHAMGCGCIEGHESKSGQKIMYALFSFPLVLGFLLPPKLLDSTLAAKKGIIFHQVPARKTPDPQPDPYARNGEIDHQWWEEYEFEIQASRAEGLPEEQQILKEELGLWYDQEYYSRLAGELLTQNRIIVQDRGFLDIMLVISAYQHYFQDREIQLTGFVYRDLSMNENELAVTRTAITCCLADATFYGILVRGNGIDSFEQDSWVTVTGLIDQDLVFGQNMLMIRALEIKEVPPPDTPYVYPYLYRQYMP
ncbi:TIGR03943 family putative permease subunit [Desulfonatronovibrio hydrogenovorans]|uniref:TIGR03943 family putative permease subunit n=1 Tax=Desulfonatronovibrio hydrogenovorans TaxID=53245 RepID=UPI00048ADDD4|nr:TIGR03943 family protein [Desulfonatronovibrio hydrogenovorans]